MTKKRATGDAAAPSSHDGASLQRITRALESVTRVADSWCCGYDTRFPRPTLSFKSDGQSGSEREQELSLPLPLRPEDCELLKARGVVSQRCEGAAVAWDVRGDLVESRNPSWHAFLNKQLVWIRRRFGFFDHEGAKLSLRKMMLAEAGAHLVGDVEEHHAIRPSGAFGTFVVVLPGLFEGGRVEIRQEQQENNASNDEDEDEDEDESDDDGYDNDDDDDHDSDSFWRPDDRDHAYCVAYAAFYDHFERVASPLTSGSALCLVYDLVTTPRDVDLLKGSQVAQHCVNRALTGHFQVMPEPLVKRLKISADAWESVRKFALDRSFVYILQGKEYEDSGKTFNDLKCDDRLVADSLATFCAQSKGEYVLYFARAFCCRYVGSSSSSSDEDSSAENEDKHERDSFVTLKAPWLKCGVLTPATFHPRYVNQRREVAPMGRVDQLPLGRHRYHYALEDKDIVEQLYGTRSFAKCIKHTTYALVVLPATVEDCESTKVPLREVVIRLRAKLSESRKEALCYARRVVANRPTIKVHSGPDTGFNGLVDLVVKINDRQLFHELLSSVRLYQRDDTGDLREAVEHFGWESCEAVVIHQLHTVPSLQERVNLFTSTVDPYDITGRVDRLLDELLSRNPWTDTFVDSDEYHDPFCNSEVFSRLLEVVYQSSPHRLIEVVSVRHGHELVLTVTSGVRMFAQAHPDEEKPWSVLVHVRDLLPSMRPEILNDTFSRTPIKAHCPTCSEIRSFFLSTVTDTAIQCGSSGEVEHIKAVLADSLEKCDLVTVEIIDGHAVRLTKKLDPNDGLWSDAMHRQGFLTSILALRERPPPLLVSDTPVRDAA